MPDSFFIRFQMRKFLPAIIGFTVLIVLNNVLLLFTPRFITPTTTEHFFEDLKTIYRNARVIMFTFRVSTSMKTTVFLILPELNSF